MSSKVIIEETNGARTFRLSGAQYLGVAQFAANLADRGMLQLDRLEAEFLARALRAALDAMPAGADNMMPQEPMAAPATEQPPAKTAEPPPRAGKRWEVAEDEKLIVEFKKGIDLKAIAKDFGRTPTAIIERLLFHKLVVVTPVEQASENA